MSTVRIQLRRGLADDWTSADPTLAAGEVGLESDTGKFKFGDGSTAWATLPYALENTLGDYVLLSDVGQPNGVASLNSSGKVPANQLDISELSQDAVNTALVAGTGISKSYDDNANTITLSVNATTSNISEGTNLYFTDERAQDAVNTAIVAGSNLVKAYNDNDNTITISMPNDITLTGYVNSDLLVANSAEINGELTADSVTISGDLVVNGTFSSVPTETLVVENPMIYLAESNPANSLDIGIVGSHTISGTYSHTGLVKDASDGLWKLFSGVVSEPGNTVDFSTWTKDDMQVGGLYAEEAQIGNVTNTEIQYLAGVGSNIKDQIDSKLSTSTASSTYAPIASPTFTGNVSGITKGMVGLSNVDNTTDANKPVSTATQTALDLKANITDQTFSGIVVLPSTTSIGNVTSTEIGYVSGVTSSIQTQLSQKTTDLENHNSDTTNVHGITDTAELATKSYADSAVQTHQNDTTSIHGIADTAELATKTYADSAVTTHQNDTTNIHGIADTSVLVTLSGTETLTGKTIALGSNTVSGTTAQFNSAITDGDFATLAGSETLTNKTITSPAGLVKADVGLANVDNTSDANKPISTATQTALDLKSNLASPTFTGNVVLPSTTSVGNVSSTEIGYLDGVTSAIQTQIDAKLSKSGGTMTGDLTLAGAPSADLHAATKAYVDNVVSGINFHEAVRVATTANITLSGTQTIDGVSVVAGNRVLVKDQTDQKTNGIYVVDASTWSRAADADNTPSGELKGGDFCLVLEGGQSGYGYVCSNTSAITIGSTNITYTAFNSAKAIIAGSGLTESTPGTLDIATGGVTSAMIENGTIVDGDINASAAIAQSKISGLTADLAAKAPTSAPTFTGLVTLSSSGIAFTDGTQTLEGVPSRTPIIQKTASYTLSALTERDDLIEMGSSSAITLSIPTDATLNFPIGTSIDILQTGTGQVTIAAVTPGTTTVNGTPGLKLRTQWSSCTLFKRAANTWVVMGDLSA
jgi:hypothetical protein